MLNRAELLAHWRARGIDPGRCFYTDWPTGGVFEVDHLIPITRGGTDAIANLVPCLPTIRQMKTYLTAVEFDAVLDAPEPEFDIAV
ncbi:HNH endonuclease domain-containing protein [Mycolicibacterium sp.]|uniref:HNH endonuclease n=1 Tax=Mycolicibacterium sp. TaxID=2320850 RepID=UPI0028B22530|nr:HNH endonuclease domain-containing protein [Mycolicibacterium sp.]